MASIKPIKEEESYNDLLLKTYHADNKSGKDKDNTYVFMRPVNAIALEIEPGSQRHYLFEFIFRYICGGVDKSYNKDIILHEDMYCLCMTLDNIGKMLGWSRRKVQDYIGKLKDDDVIGQKYDGGRGKSACYFITESALRRIAALGRSEASSLFKNQEVDEEKPKRKLKTEKSVGDKILPNKNDVTAKKLIDFYKEEAKKTNTRISLTDHKAALKAFKKLLQYDEEFAKNIIRYMFSGNYFFWKKKQPPSYLNFNNDNIMSEVIANTESWLKGEVPGKEKIIGKFTTKLTEKKDNVWEDVVK
jgi:DNA-binding transcriptional regulator GbsR (MarR family)